jgi:hypothetical protein
MIRKLVLLVLALAAFASAPAALSASDDSAGLAFYEKEAKDILKAAAEKVWSAADDARKQGFMQFVEEQAERTLEFDPDNKEAREYLKYVKKDGKWVQDEEAFKKMQHQNVHNQAESQEGFDKRLKKWQEGSLANANKYVAAKYAELGDACAAKGYADQAQKGYEAAMRLDKENEKARKGLGYTKFGKVWLTKKQDEARKAASKSDVVKEDGQTVYEELFGCKLNKIESAHYRFESPYAVDELKQYCTAAETMYAYYLADFGKDPGEDVWEGHKALFVVLQTEDQWNKTIDRFASDKEFTRQLGGCNLGVNAEAIRTNQGSTMEARRDMIVHNSCHFMNHAVWRLSEHAWLDEGLAYYYTMKVLESCSTHCVAEKKGDYANGHVDEGGLKKWDSSDAWKPLLKALVMKKDDTPLRTISMIPLTKLQFTDTVKAWSVASWLMDLDRDKFTSVLDQMLDRSVKQENVFQGSYGKGWEAIDDDWHAYVKKAY